MSQPCERTDGASPLPSALVRTLILLLVLGTLCMACARDDDADQIRNRIAEGADLAEAHDIGSLLKLASDEIRAMPMNLDRRGIKAVLWQAFRRYGSFAILYPTPTIDVAEHGQDASTELPFLIVRKELDLPELDTLRDNPLAWVAAIGDHADLFRLRMQWRRQDGDWLVDLVFLERFDGSGFE